MWIEIYVCDYIGYENQIIGIMQKEKSHIAFQNMVHNFTSVHLEWELLLYFDVGSITVLFLIYIKM
jgi:hypothetical protein